MFVPYLVLLHGLFEAERYAARHHALVSGQHDNGRHCERDQRTAGQQPVEEHRVKPLPVKTAQNR